MEGIDVELHAADSSQHLPVLRHHLTFHFLPVHGETLASRHIEWVAGKVGGKGGCMQHAARTQPHPLFEESDGLPECKLTYLTSLVRDGESETARV